MPSIDIRPVREEDLPALAEIYNDEVAHGTATFDTDPRSLDAMRKWLLPSEGRRLSLVAAEDEKVIGFSALYTWSPRKAYESTAENTVYLRKDCRGRGVGKLLLEAILEEGRRAGIHCVIARISCGNDSSIRLHERLGFESVGTMKEVGRKFGRLLDVHLMQKIL
jgi:phosphinothricin acetyltransferase